MKRITYEITSKDNWDVPNMEMIETDNRVALKFTLNGVDVTDKNEIIKACNFWSTHCRYEMRRFSASSKYHKDAKRELDLLTAYADLQLIQTEQEQHS